MDIQKGVENLNFICDNKKFDSLLFNVKYKDLDCRIIYIRKSKVMLIAIRDKNIGWFVPIDSTYNISTFIPRDIFFKIVDSLDIDEFDTTKKTTKQFFMSIKDRIETLISEQVNSIKSLSRKELNEMIGDTVTSDKTYDKENGLKPYFDTWVRNDVKDVSKDNLKKTRRVFGTEIESLCLKNNISSRWSGTPTKNSLSIYNYNQNLNYFEK